MRARDLLPSIQTRRATQGVNSNEARKQRVVSVRLEEVINLQGIVEHMLGLHALLVHSWLANAHLVHDHGGARLLLFLRSIIGELVGFVSFALSGAAAPDTPATQVGARARLGRSDRGRLRGLSGTQLATRGSKGYATTS